MKLEMYEEARAQNTWEINCGLLVYLRGKGELKEGCHCVLGRCFWKLREVKTGSKEMNLEVITV